MALSPLTARQQAAIDGLVAERRIEPVTADARRATTFLDRAVAAVTEKLMHPDIAYNVAYDACHDIGEAVLAAYGYRTASGSGQHDATGRFLKAVLDTPPGDQAAGAFDRLRRSRNQSRYDAKPVGRAQADHAKTVAQGLIAAAVARGVGQ